MLKCLIIALLIAGPACAKGSFKVPQNKPHVLDTVTVKDRKASDSDSDADADYSAPLEDGDRYEKNLFRFRNGPEVYNYFIINQDGDLSKDMGFGLRWRF